MKPVPFNVIIKVNFCFSFCLTFACSILEQVNLSLFVVPLYLGMSSGVLFLSMGSLLSSLIPFGDGLLSSRRP